MIKAVGIDVDGTLTDGKVYCSAAGEEMLCFDRRDGHGIAMLQDAGIEVFIMSSEYNEMAEKRCEKLKTRHYLGVKDKASSIEIFLKSKNITWEEFAYIGDDVNDLEVLKKAAMIGIPNDAIIKDRDIETANYRFMRVFCTRNGGNGCVREFCEAVLLYNGKPEKKEELCGIQ